MVIIYAKIKGNHRKERRICTIQGTGKSKEYFLTMFMRCRTSHLCWAFSTFHDFERGKGSVWGNTPVRKKIARRKFMASLTKILKKQLIWASLSLKEEILDVTEGAIIS